MQQPSGKLIVDANVLGRLAEPLDRERLIASLRVADLQVWPTAVNVLEAARHRNAAIRTKLLSTVGALAAGRPVLPLPLDFLRATGRMIQRGEYAFTHVPSRLEWMVEHPQRVSDEDAVKAGEMLDEPEESFARMHQKARRELRSYLRESGIGDAWGSIPAFLENQWMSPGHIDVYFTRLWTQLGMDGEAPLGRLKSNEAWRLFFEGFGATAYERAVRSQSQQPAHLYDILQLVYMSGTAKRIFATDDRGLARVGSAVTHMRYPNSRVISTAELLAEAP